MFHPDFSASHSLYTFPIGYTGTAFSLLHKETIPAFISTRISLRCTGSVSSVHYCSLHAVWQQLARLRRQTRGRMWDNLQTPPQSGQRQHGHVSVALLFALLLG